MVPSGPEIRCSSSWMIRSGGSSGGRCRAAGPARLGGAVEPVRVVAVDMAEERAALADPGQRRELVDGRDQEGRQPAVDRLVDGHDRQRAVAGEVALEFAQRISRLCRRGRRSARSGTTVGRERRAAPRAVLERRGARLSLPLLVARTPVDAPCRRRCRPCRRACSAWRRVPTHRPISNGQSPSSLRLRRVVASSRISSSAQTRPAARASWSSVSRRSV